MLAIANARTKENPYGIQKAAEQYFRPEYLSPARLSSIGYQFQFAIESGGQTFLNIGTAHGLLEQMLIQLGHTVVGVDIDPLVMPDLIALLPQLPFSDNSFDTVMAFQVLEHMPLELLSDCFSEMGRVSRAKVIISLPDQSPLSEIAVPTSGLEKLAVRFHKWTVRRQKWRQRVALQMDPEHFWEMGIDGVTEETVLATACEAQLDFAQMLRNPCFSYHRFFIFDKH